MKERTKRLCDSIIALSLAVSVLSSAAAIKTYSTRFDVARPGVTAFAAEDGETEEPAEDATESVVVYAKINGEDTLYPNTDGFTVAAGKTSVDIKSDLQIDDPTTGGNEGEEFQGWALEEKGTPVGETIEVSKFKEKDGNTLTLYPVWGEQGEQNDVADPEEEGDNAEEKEDAKLTEEQQKELTDATTAFNKVKSDAETVRTNAGKADADKEKLQTEIEKLKSELNSAKETLDKIPEELQTDAAYTVAKKAYAAADDMLNSAEYTVGQLLSAADKVRIEQIKQYFEEATAFVNEAKAAADKKDADLYNKKKKAASEKENQAISTAKAAENPDAVIAATQADYDKYADAVHAALMSYTENIAVAKDADGNEYTGSELYLDTADYEIYTDGKAALTYMENVNSTITNSDNYYAKVFKFTLKTIKDDKPVTLSSGETFSASSMYIGDLEKKAKTCEVYYVFPNNNDYEEVGYYAWRSEINKYGYDSVLINIEHDKFDGLFVITGQYYTKQGVIVYDENDDSKQYNQDDVTKNQSDIIEVTAVTDEALKKQAIRSLNDAERANVVAVYDIKLKGNNKLAEGAKVKVKVTDAALKSAKVTEIDLAHISSSGSVSETFKNLSVDSTGTFYFETGSFSYFVAMKPTSTSSSSSSSGDSSSTGTGLTSPRTGEGSPLPFVLAAFGALGVAGGVVVWRKKKTAED